MEIRHNIIMIICIVTIYSCLFGGKYCEHVCILQETRSIVALLKKFAIMTSFRVMNYVSTVFDPPGAQIAT